MSALRDDVWWDEPEPVTLSEQAEFDADLAYLRGLGDAIAEHALPRSGHLLYPYAPTIEQQVAAEMPGMAELLRAW